MTARCAAAVVGAPTKEYAHTYSMMHRRLTTAGIEFAPHYHQLLVYNEDKENPVTIKCNSEKTELPIVGEIYVPWGRV